MIDEETRESAPTNPMVGRGVTTLEQLMARRYSRRGFVKTTLAAAVISGAGALAGCQRSRRPFDFVEIEHGIDTSHHVAPDHDAEVLIRWGDPLFADSLPFDPENQSAEAQERQFGCNNDYIGFLPLEPAPDGEARALLCINHESANAASMLPNLKPGVPILKTKEQCELEKAAMGNTIVEIIHRNGHWEVVGSAKYNRRISTRSTAMEMTGPAAGHARLKTDSDPAGRNVIGTLGNCAGGMTPWGTYLTCEENFNGAFAGSLAADHPEVENHKRYGVPGNWAQWGRFDPRFDVGSEPNEANRFGWVVEIDPLDPASTPKKRTALGRFKHEGAETVVAPDGRLVVYMGDDEGV